MDKMLKSTFDLQKFLKNKQFDALISATHLRYNNEISEDDLSKVSAAGDPCIRSYSSSKTKGENYD